MPHQKEMPRRHPGEVSRGWPGVRVWGSGERAGLQTNIWRASAYSCTSSPESAQLGAGADAHGPRNEPGKQSEGRKTRVGARGALLEAEGTKHCQAQEAVGQGR